MTSRAELLRTIAALRKPKPWMGEELPDPKNALRAKTCRCEGGPIPQQDEDGTVTCFRCAKALS